MPVINHIIRLEEELFFFLSRRTAFQIALAKHTNLSVSAAPSEIQRIVKTLAATGIVRIPKQRQQHPIMAALWANVNNPVIQFHANIPYNNGRGAVVRQTESTSGISPASTQHP